DCDDRNHHQEFDQRERPSLQSLSCHLPEYEEFYRPNQRFLNSLFLAVWLKKVSVSEGRAIQFPAEILQPQPANPAQRQGIDFEFPRIHHAHRDWFWLGRFIFPK